MVLIIMEPPTVEPYYYNPRLRSFFGKVAIMIDDYVDNKKYIKLYYPQPNLEYIVNPVPFTQKKFCTLISRQ